MLDVDVVGTIFMYESVAPGVAVSPCFDVMMVELFPGWRNGKPSLVFAQLCN